MTTTISSIFFEVIGVGWYRRRQGRRIHELEQLRKVFEAAEKSKNDIRTMGQIQRYHLLQMSRAEFDRLAQGKDLDLNTCPMGTLFVCKPFELLPNIIIVGQIVRGLDMFADQWGAGLSVPERGINRFRVEIIN
jgi:hypothetical protein